MCGRFVVASSPQLLADQFDVDEVTVDTPKPQYNVAPRQQVMVVRQREDVRVLSQLRWGLVPSWAKTAAIGDRMINARAEGLAEKPAYKRPFAKHRCIIPADGFYEWQVVAPPTTPKGRPKKQPVFIHRRDGEPMALAGLWAAWKVPEGIKVDGVKEAQASVSGRGTPARSELRDGDGWLRSCVIVTTKPNDLLAPVHDRMPVVLPKSEWARWLNPEDHDVDALAELLVPLPDDVLELWPVSTLVNKAGTNDPELVKPVGAVVRRS
ncbi:MAG: SOS response-associated peptidase [Acidimicrobiia bacterium]|nr:SOS response-associated peptidase [Acidimicrobiia bacterium]